jgi:hypothetical protein
MKFLKGKEGEGREGKREREKERERRELENKKTALYWYIWKVYRAIASMLLSPGTQINL